MAVPTEREPADGPNDPVLPVDPVDRHDPNDSASITSVAPVASATSVNPERAAGSVRRRPHGLGVGDPDPRRAGTPDGAAGFAEASQHPAAGAASGPLFPTGNVLRVIGVSRRQLQYWAETGLVAPSARTPGGHGRYTLADLVALKAAKQLIDAGISVQRIRSSIGALKRLLPQVRHPLSELVLVATGDVVLVLREGTAFEALSGQEWIVEVARFQREIEHVLGSDEAVASKPALGKNPGPRTAVKVAARRREDARIA